MAPGKRARVIKVRAPRHNAQRIGTKLGAEIKNVSRAQKVRVEIYQPGPEVAQAVESASEWNSLLITARADRGPQWDVGTQQFHVDKDSELYYDPTVLMEAVKKQTDEAQAEEQQQQQQHAQHLAPQQMHQSNSRHHTPRGERDYHMSNAHHQMGPPGHDPSMARHHAPPVNYPYPTTSANMRGPMPMPNRQQYPGVPRGAPFNTAPPGQFYGGENASPMRMGPMGGMGMMDHGSGVGVSGMPSGMGMGWDGGGMAMNRMHS